ncbi:hypothetical protein HUB98_05255 [Paenibacillus barcinonensis]|uniref:Uncharacterized protein n=1 Tax=Paenibacillus barcinonensis TaxID=198119 RepID=A0A2V4VEA7_PAEBA|nr:hypothetical protein [Paenibacillus barcinonensis]PYE51394.1 hypothetical protein DFQ00_102188 [Paenibacillus barcinonensis]QKS55790.1 hypothetical protein HUB98_05255 [Paenibacillus barcinonensis]
MNIELTAHFYFKGSGKKKSIIWIEDNPRLQQKEKDSDKVIREIPLTADEVKQEYRRLFTKHKNEGKSITLEDTTEMVHIIDLTDIRNIELVSREVETDAVQTDLRTE